MANDGAMRSSCRQLYLHTWLSLKQSMQLMVCFWITGTCLHYGFLKKMKHFALLLWEHKRRNMKIISMLPFHQTTWNKNSHLMLWLYRVFSCIGVSHTSVSHPTRGIQHHRKCLSRFVFWCCRILIEGFFLCYIICKVNTWQNWNKLMLLKFYPTCLYIFIRYFSQVRYVFST